MTKIFMIAPYGIDPYYTDKRTIAYAVSSQYGAQILRAENTVTGDGLSAKETAILFYECDFAIADLSYERPSCYYEVGYMQAMRKNTYLIAHTGTAIHQVLGADNVSYYNSLDNYRELLQQIIENCSISCLHAAHTDTSSILHLGIT